MKRTRAKFPAILLALAFLLPSQLPSLHAKALEYGNWASMYNGSFTVAEMIGSGETRAQKFNAAHFCSLEVFGQSWYNSIGNLTLTLYRWRTDYAATVAGTPIASRTFVDFTDNSWLQLSFFEQPAGDYLWVLSSPTEQELCDGVSRDSAEIARGVAFIICNVPI